MNVTSACPSTGFLKNPFAAFAEVVVFRVYRWFSRNNNDGDLAPAVSEALKEFEPIHLGHVNVRDYTVAAGRSVRFEEIFGRQIGFRPVAGRCQQILK